MKGGDLEGKTKRLIVFFQGVPLKPFLVTSDTGCEDVDILRKASNDPDSAASGFQKQHLSAVAIAHDHFNQEHDT